MRSPHSRTSNWRRPAPTPARGPDETSSIWHLPANDIDHETMHAGGLIVIWRDAVKVTVPPEDIPELLPDAYGYDITGHAPASAEQADASIPARNR